MYGSILNQVEPSVNLYSQTTRPSSYYGIWTTTLGVNQVTFVKDLESSTIAGYNSNVMIIKQLDNKNKYKTKLIRTMQIDENSDIYFSGCTINNGQSNQIYYGTGYSWILVNNEYTPPSGGGGELSYNLFAQATEPDTYDGIWTTNTDITSVETTDTILSEVIDSNMFTVSHIFGQEFIQNGDILYMISGVYSSNTVVSANGFGTGFIWVYNMITKKLIKTIPIPGCTGLYMHSCVLYNNKIYIIGGRTKFDTTSISNKIYIFDITTEQFETRTIIPKLYGNNCVIYKDIIYIIYGFVDSTSNMSGDIYKYNITAQTMTSTSNSNGKRFLSGCIHIDDCVYIISGFSTNTTTNPINSTYKYELLTNTWSFASRSDHISLCRGGYRYVDEKLYSISYNYVGGVSSMHYIESNLINIFTRRDVEPNISRPDFINNAGAGACVIYNDYLYCIGGYTGSALVGSVYQFNMKNFTFTVKTSLVTPRRLFGYCINNDEIYLFGGAISATSLSPTNSAIKYNITTNTYTTLTNLPATRVGRGCVVVGNFIYLFGGAAGSSADQYNSGCTYYATSHKYDITNNTYTAIADLPTTTAEMWCYKVDNNQILIVGGFTTSSTKSNQVLLYNITTNTYRALTNLPSAIAGQADASCKQDTRIFISSNTGYMKDTEGVDGTSIVDASAASSTTVYYTQRAFVYNNILYTAIVNESSNLSRLKLSKYKSKISKKIGGLDSSLLMYKNKPYINFNFGDASTAQKSLVGRLYEVGDGVDTYNTFFNFEIRKTCTSSCIRDNKLYVYAESTDGIGLGQFHEYDLLTQSNPKIASSEDRPVNSNAVLYNNYIYTLGGYIRTSSADDNFATKIYRITVPAGGSVADATILKAITSPVETKRKNHSSIIYGNTMYSVGGYTLKNKSVATNTLIKVNLDDFNNDIMTVTTLENCPKDIVDADAVCIGNKMYLLFGYQKSTESFNMDILVYDITNNTWSTDLATTISLRYHKTIVRNGNIYIFGGENATGSVDTIYRYNPMTKEIVTYGTLPNKISRFGLAYWSEKDYAVIAGGYDTTTSLEYSKIFYYDFKIRDFINQSNSNTLYLNMSNNNTHSTKLISDSNTKVAFADVFINSEEPYDVYKGDGTQWIKIT